MGQIHNKVRRVFSQEKYIINCANLNLIKNIKVYLILYMSETDYPVPIQEGWIPWFCGLQEHEFFCQIDNEFLLDEYNLKGLR